MGERAPTLAHGSAWRTIRLRRAESASCERGPRLREDSYAGVSEPLWPWTFIDVHLPAFT